MKCALLVLGCDGLNPNTTNYYPVTMGSQLYHMPHPEASDLIELRTVLMKLKFWCQLVDKEEVCTLS